MTMGALSCPYCGLALALLPVSSGIVKHCCPATKTWQSGCVRPLEEGECWFLGMCDQVHLTAENERGTGHVRVLTGRWNDDGSVEVLIGARGRDDMHAIERLDGYCSRARADRV